MHAHSIVEMFEQEMKLLSFTCDIVDINELTYHKMILECFISFQTFAFLFLIFICRNIDAIVGHSPVYERDEAMVN